MSERNIFVTAEDRKRLIGMMQVSATPRDREDMGELLSEIHRATVVPASDIPPDVITMNSQARLLDLDQGTTLEYTLVYPHDADFAKGRISVLAPIGAAMLGYRVGDEIEWTVPGGVRHLRVESVAYQPEASGHYTR